MLPNADHGQKIDNIHQPSLLSRPVCGLRAARHNELRAFGLHLVSLVFRDARLEREQMLLL